MPDKNIIEPLINNSLSDYHVHCDYSIDAVGTISEYCQAALKKGLAEICFTTHYDCSPGCEGKGNIIRVLGEDLPATPENLKQYVEDVQEAQDNFYPAGLMVKLGVEFGWFKGAEKSLGELLKMYEFDYILCGIHEIDDICFCCKSSYKECFERMSAAEAVAKYIEQIKEASDSGMFDCIAHLDYLRKYGLEFYGSELDEEFDRQIGACFETLVKNGTSIEINTAGMRKGLDSYFPRMKTINAARRAGVDMIKLGSDAHRPEDIGYDFDAASVFVPASNAGCESS